MRCGFAGEPTKENSTLSGVAAGGGEVVHDRGIPAGELARPLDSEARARAIRRGTRARQAAGAVHTDMERGFGAAEITPWDAPANLWLWVRVAARMRPGCDLDRAPVEP
jgi:hypothetical protein